MADYKADILKAKQRARHINMGNEIGEIPYIEFAEEIVTLEGPVVVSKVPCGSLRESFEDPSEVFDTINPLTGEVMGSMTYAEAYGIIYSLYLHMANKRDASAVGGV